MIMWTEEEFYKYKGDDEFLEVSYYGKATVRKHKEYSEYIAFYKEYQTQENLNEYNNNIDNLAYEIRKQLKDKIEKSVWDNQKCFIELWKKENPDVAMNDIVMHHCFDESGKYKFWVELKMVNSGNICAKYRGKDWTQKRINQEIEVLKQALKERIEDDES